MSPAEIIEAIKQHDSDALVATVAEGLHPHVVVQAECLAAVAAFVKSDRRLQLDLLRCLSAVDWPAQNRIEVSYELLSTVLGHHFCLKVLVDRTQPQVESLSSIWPAAEWHEREAFDLLGVTFAHHPDLRRILLPEDWTGYPLRKDYPYPASYQGVPLSS